MRWLVTSFSGSFTSVGRAPDTYWTEGWVVLTAVRDVVAEEKFTAGNRTLIQPVINHYIILLLFSQLRNSCSLLGTPKPAFPSKSRILFIFLRIQYLVYPMDKNGNTDKEQCYYCKTRDTQFKAHLFLLMELHLNAACTNRSGSSIRQQFCLSYQCIRQIEQQPDRQFIWYSSLCGRGTQTLVMTSANDHVFSVFHDTHHYFFAGGGRRSADCTVNSASCISTDIQRGGVWFYFVFDLLIFRCKVNGNFGWLKTRCWGEYLD
jgi:hypothetical protein